MYDQSDVRFKYYNSCVSNMYSPMHHITFVMKEICNKNAFQSKANLPLADRKSDTYSLTLEWPWPWGDLGQVKLS